MDRDLLLGLEDEVTGELVDVLRVHATAAVRRERARRAFGSFLTAAAAVRRAGAARAVQVRLLEEARARGYEDYLAFCEVGAVSNESIARSCSTLGLTTSTVATVPYLATPVAIVPRRTRPASGSIRAYEPGDAAGAAALPDDRRPSSIKALHDERDLDHRFLSPVARTYVQQGPDGLAALAHFALLEVRDGGRRFRNAYLRDFEPGRLDVDEREQFLSDVLRAVAGEGCHLVVAAGSAGFPLASLARLGFRQISQKLNLLFTPLFAGSGRPLTAPAAEVRLDVF